MKIDFTTNLVLPSITKRSFDSVLFYWRRSNLSLEKLQVSFLQEFLFCNSGNILKFQNEIQDPIQNFVKLMFILEMIMKIRTISFIVEGAQIRLNLYTNTTARPNHGEKSSILVQQSATSA